MTGGILEAERLQGRGPDAARPQFGLPPGLTSARLGAVPPPQRRHKSKRGLTQVGQPSFEWCSGGVLLSREASLAVPSALKSLTSGFGMGPGVSPSLWPPGTLSSCTASGRNSGATQWTRMSRSRGIHVVLVVSSPRPVSTGQLSTSRCLHFRPINPVVWLGALPTQGGGRPHLEACFPLRCFQRLSLPDVANQPCSWRNNWHTRGQSVPVLSY